ncbi:hypothetical protein PR202_gb21209 [Eleusine coracana subsp. coracana]|uniref:F-box domain-containing protein n=1 Tax=Eleusine coracana subsp. coracana TaxID=191504 RepID=A0AAV5FCJ3_ELECO|nr:hypothetical protein PR202_gb21209 [Eleusine coracana subsp. coracana]
MAAPPPSDEETPPPVLEATLLPRLPDEILELIFLRVTSYAELARISTASTSFRRLILAPSFLRRHRARHPPLLLGTICCHFHPAEQPHPGARIGGSLVHLAAFSFNNYIPRGRWSRWDCRDIRDGRFLLMCDSRDWRRFVFPDLAVYDPLSKRYRLLPLVPDSLIASAQLQMNKIQHLEVLLVSSSGHTEEEEKSFQVIARTHGTERTVIFVFSSNTGHWIFGASIAWDDLRAAGLNLAPATPTGSLSLNYAQYDDHSSIYWKLDGSDNVLKFDVNEMEFSTMNLPPDHTRQSVAIFKAGEGRLAMFSHTPYTAYVNHYTIMQNGGGSATAEWQLENVIPLPCNCTFIGALQGYVFLLGYCHSKEETLVGMALYSLEVKTLKLERVHGMQNLDHGQSQHAYGSWLFS